MDHKPNSHKMLKGKFQLLNKVNLIIWKEGRQPRSQGLLTSCHHSAKMRDPKNLAVAKQKKNVVCVI